MALVTSGAISIGGTTTNRSINLEISRSATATSSLGETDLRTLAGVSSGAISMSDFYGASSAWIITEGSEGTTYGHTASIGSISPTTYNSSTIKSIATSSITIKGSTTYLLVCTFSGNQSTSFFSSISIGGIANAQSTFSRVYSSEFDHTIFSKNINSNQMMDGSGTTTVLFT
jgi:hypothetical protein